MKIPQLAYFITLTVLAQFCLSVTGQAAAIDPQLASMLQSSAVTEELSVIVTFTPPDDASGVRKNILAMSPADMVSSMRNQTAVSGSDLRQYLAARGVRDITSLWIINSVSFKAGPELVSALRNFPGIEEIRLNGTVYLPQIAMQAAGMQEWNVLDVGAADLWDLGMTGQGVVIAGLDTGVDIDHPELIGKWHGGGISSWYDPNEEHPDMPYDADGHGTAVMGVMVGGSLDGTAIGVAPEAQWIAAKIFNDAGAASYEAIHLAFQWLLDPDGDGDTGDAPDIVNSSWGFQTVNTCIDEFIPDVRALKTAGIAFVVSAGNFGPASGTGSSLANYGESLAIGTIDENHRLADFSSRGPSSCPAADTVFPQLTAPGVNIKTTDLTFGGVIPDAYVFATGSSFAAPHVSGILALLLENEGFPATDIATLENAVHFSADDLGPQGPDNGYGYGMINGLAAARRLGLLPHLAVYDPAAPENDQALDFGAVSPATGMTRDITLTNTGGGSLILEDVVLTADGGVFTVISDFCSGQVLDVDGVCVVQIEFRPAAAADYAGLLSIGTNDPDSAESIVTLAGSGLAIPAPPSLSVAPDNEVIAFGSVAPGQSSANTLTITNTGDELLEIDRVDTSTLGAAFAVAADTCSLQSLALHETCSITLDFSPQTVGDFQSSMTIISNDSVSETLVLTISGAGNHSPDAATLLAPVNGSAGLGASVTFLWTPAEDPDGDAVRETFVLSDSTGTVILSRQVGSTQDFVPFLSMMGVIFVLQLSASVRRRNGRRLAVLTILGFLIFLSHACSSGGDSAVPMSSSGTHTETRLQPATTYLWKIISTDANGGTSESATWHFTTHSLF